MASIEGYESLTRPPSAVWRVSKYRRRPATSGAAPDHEHAEMRNFVAKSQRRATGQGLTSPRAHRSPAPGTAR
jgi:hypothetical protein